MPTASDESLESIQSTLTEAEERISERRRTAQDRFDTLQAKITGLYRDQIDGLTPEA